MAYWWQSLIILSFTQSFFADCLPIERLSVHVKCGDEVVANAKLHLHEYKNDFPHRELADGHTGQRGHFHFHRLEDLKNADFHSVKLRISDQCGINFDKIRCNLPYYTFDIPLNKLFVNENKNQNVAVLDLKDPAWLHIRSLHCL
uniref:Uncharacterized protein n=1 Tax=Caenorhabditis japonica TaxID=281687 RepID=A0A8R1HJH1_CAEJA